VAVAAGRWHSLGLKTDGSVVGWGWNGDGQINVPAPNANFLAIAAGAAHSLGLKADGSIVGWGYNGFGQTTVPGPNASFVAVATGYNHSLGLKSDGSIVAWGSNGFGQISLPVPNSGFVAVAAAGDHSLALKSNGSIVAWGNNISGQTNVSAPNSDFVAVAAGGSHSLGVKSDGSIVGWGNNAFGQFSVPAPNSGFVAVAGGELHTLALRIIDADSDGVADGVDNCPNIANPGQEDCQPNGIGDACDILAGDPQDVVSETFEDISTLAGNGWTMINLSEPLGVTDWFQGDDVGAFDAHEGPTDSYIAANYDNAADGPGLDTISNWLILPEMLLVDDMTLSFYTRTIAESTWPDSLEVRMSLAGASMDVGTSATSVGDFSNLLLTINPSFVQGGYPESWTEFVVTLSGIGAPTSGRLALRYFLPDAGPFGANSLYVGIDTLTVTDPGTPTSEDCDGNGVPDECENHEDCQPNGVGDHCDIASGDSEDCNINGIPDECESPDCSAELAAANINSGGDYSSASTARGEATYELIASTGQQGGIGVLTSANYTLSDGFWYRVQAMGGSVAPPAAAPFPHDARKHRYVSIDATANGTTPVAYEVELVSMKRCSGDLNRACREDGNCNGGATGPCVEHPSVPAVLGYVQAPYTVASGCSPNACGPTDLVARVDATPVFRVWTENTLHIGDCEITPIATYELRATTDGVIFSDPLTIATVELPQISPSYFGGFGDVAEAPIGGQYQPPGGIGNITDIQAYVNTVVNYPTIDPTKPWAHRTWVDIVGLGTGTPPQYIPNASDLLSILQGLQDAKWLANADNRYPADCPPNCGDGYCDSDAGEDNAACPADCP